MQQLSSLWQNNVSENGLYIKSEIRRHYPIMQNRGGVNGNSRQQHHLHACPYWNHFHETYENHLEHVEIDVGVGVGVGAGDAEKDENQTQWQ